MLSGGSLGKEYGSLGNDDFEQGLRTQRGTPLVRALLEKGTHEKPESYQKQVFYPSLNKIREQGKGGGKKKPISQENHNKETLWGGLELRA